MREKAKDACKYHPKAADCEEGLVGRFLSIMQGPTPDQTPVPSDYSVHVDLPSNAKQGWHLIEERTAWCKTAFDDFKAGWKKWNASAKSGLFKKTTEVVAAVKDVTTTPAVGTLISKLVAFSTELEGSKPVWPTMNGGEGCFQGADKHRPNPKTKNDCCPALDSPTAAVGVILENAFKEQCTRVFEDINANIAAVMQAVGYTEKKELSIDEKGISGALKMMKTEADRLTTAIQGLTTAIGDDQNGLVKKHNECQTELGELVVATGPPDSPQKTFEIIHKESIAQANKEYTEKVNPLKAAVLAAFQQLPAELSPSNAVKDVDQKAILAQEQLLTDTAIKLVTQTKALFDALHEAHKKADGALKNGKAAADADLVKRQNEKKGSCASIETNIGEQKQTKTDTETKRKQYVDAWNTGMTSELKESITTEIIAPGEGPTCGCAR
jgi:hypothetical protein